MRNIFISMAIAAILLAGCSRNQTKEQEPSKDVHVHEDGTVHQNHEEDTVVTQEEFIVPVDSASQIEEIKHKHTHDQNDGHKHPHKH